MSTNGKYKRHDNTGTIFTRRGGVGEKGPLGSGKIKLGTTYATEATLGEKEATVWPAKRSPATRDWFIAAEKTHGPCPGFFTIIFEEVAYRDQGDEQTWKSAIMRLGDKQGLDVGDEAKLEGAKAALRVHDPVWLKAHLEQPVPAA